MDKFIISQNGLTKKEKGDRFENVCKNVLKYNPEFLYDDVWLYNDIPQKIRNKLNLPENDRGIDLLCKHDGEYYAVQCKYRSNPDACINFQSLSTFCTQVSHRSLKGIIMTNTAEIDSEMTYGDYDVYLGDFFDQLSDDYFNIKEPTNPVITKKVLRDYQKECIAQIKSYHDESSEPNKGKIISMCGTGKTLMMYHSTKRYSKILILTPSLYLLSQTYRTFLSEDYSRQIKRKYLIIGSDYDDKESIHVSIRSTTNEKVIKEFLKSNDYFSVFCTYASANNILVNLDYEFDIICYDEAHRLAGIGTEYSKLLDGINSFYKLFWTATERVYASKKRK